MNKFRIFNEAIHLSRYIKKNHCLPACYVSKQTARAGRKKGSLKSFQTGKMIGGDTYYNRNGLLPPGKKYRECDLGTYGKTSRGSYRLVFANDTDFYVTFDHYVSFTKLVV